MPGSSVLLEGLVNSQAEKFAAVAKDPAALARMLGEWIAAQWPERVRAAYWVTVEGDYDKGFEVTVAERKVPWFKSVRGSALIGRETWGGGVFVDVMEKNVNGRHVTASVGLGAVKPYTGGDWKVAASVSIRF